MGTRLKRLREAAGLSQVKLAAAAGVSPRALQNWEYGKRTFDFEAAVKIAGALGVSLDQLAGLAEAPAPKKKGK
jgi:transcriptional regulator with XRE-family HTH domain